jgi:predicted nucleic acid-binding protein
LAQARPTPWVASVLDATVLSNFAHVARPSVLVAVFDDSAVTTPVVVGEVSEGVRLGRIPSRDWSWLRVVELSSSESRHASGLRQTVDLGESQCIAVAMSRGGCFLSDDRAARRLAESLGVSVSGTLGVLRKLVVGDHVTAESADEMHSVMVARGFRSPERRFREWLAGST